MNSPEDIPQTTDSNTAQRGAEVAIAPCPKCGTDAAQNGFVVATTTYQAYNRSAGKIVMSYRKKSHVQVVHCALCNQPLVLDVESLTKAA